MCVFTGGPRSGTVVACGGLCEIRDYAPSRAEWRATYLKPPTKPSVFVVQHDVEYAHVCRTVRVPDDDCGLHLLLYF